MPQTLLLADDSATIQRVIELTFAGEDIKVVAVSDGDQAIARLDAAPPDIVLADVGMPGKSGYEVAEYVKHTAKLKHIPVVLLTGAFEPVDQVKAAAAGCDGVLAKPFEPQVVIGRVRELLGRPAESPNDSPLAIPASVVDFVPATTPAAVAQAIAPSEEAPAPEPAAARVEDYFDRLDAAFASLNTTAPPSAPAPQLAVPEDLDWLRPQAATEVGETDFAISQDASSETAVEPPHAVEMAPAPEEPPTMASALEPALDPSAPPSHEVSRPAPVLEPLVVERPEPLQFHEPRTLPSLADAFGVILAAEQNALGVRPEWPAPSRDVSAPPPAEVVITDELVDRVARRVLDQMSDRVVRETVAAIASEAAERLVRDEIERIKASIK